jgi:spermidine synthase
MAWFFAFFLVSGFCSLVYQVVWLRLAMAGFGVTAPMVAIVLSTFMAGLALGSWAAGRLARAESVPPALPLRLYALAELGIAVGGAVVPFGLVLGRSWLASAADVAWGSLRHYLASGLCVAVVLLPFCACMGATFPLAMWAIRRWMPARSPRSFSYLYLANVLGAALGTLASAFVLVELLGFRRTALLAAALNALLAATAWALSLTRRALPEPTLTKGADADGAPPLARPIASLRPVPWLLFTTGLASMGMEVVWVRQFTPYLGTVVYAFATIVALYLVATCLGSWAYRRWQRAEDDRRAAGWLWPALALAGLFPLLAADPRLPFPPHVLAGAARVALGIAPLCVLLGFVTPLLLDRWSRGDADRAGSAYALNVIGCILGPLLAGFVLLPGLGENGALLVLALPLFGAGLAAARLLEGRRARVAWAAAAIAALMLLRGTRDFATTFPRRVVIRDHAATVIAAGQGQSKRLLVNGVGMTVLTPVTKLMAHLPLAFADAPPRRSLVVCFGMGTTFRSLLSWDIDSTAVELVPSVPQLFGFFHADGPRRARSPLAHIVIDDGRRFLERSREEYDVITIDPPPPVEAAGSSLLYSREFYELAARRLRPGGVLQQWVPGGDGLVFASFTRAIGQSFRHVRAFRSLGGIGVHFLASDRRLPSLTPAELAARLPPEASVDLVEWGPASTPAEQFAIVTGQEVAVSDLLQMAPGAPALSDDRPVNEYYLLRQARRQ